MRANIPPSRYVMLGQEDNNEELWTEYRLGDPNYIKPSIQPQWLHPVQIKNILRNQNCPIIQALNRWFGNVTNEIINEENLEIGRFLQKAYN